MELERHEESNCPYCSTRMRRIPGAWLGRDGFECSHCGDFVDFSRPLTAADCDGVVEERAEDLAPAP